MDTDSWRTIAVRLTSRSRNAESGVAARVKRAPIEAVARAASTASWPRASAAGRPREVAGRLEAALSANGRRLARPFVGRRRKALDRLHHALADAARRHVDHAPQADVVVRVDDQAHVRQRVLDLLALVEPHAADDLVRQPLAHQRVFDRPRLRVGPVEHRDRWRRRRRRARPGGAGDEVGLLELVAAAEIERCGRRPVRSVQRRLSLRFRFWLMTAGGRVQDDLGGSVVSLELDGRAPRGSPARSRGCCAGRRRATCRWTGRDRRRRRGCGGPRRAAESAGTAAGSCPGIRPPSRTGTARRISREPSPIARRGRPS